MARKTVRPMVGVAVSVAGRMASKLRVPIIYFHLPNMHTACILTLYVLHKIQVTTGRRIIVISNWPYWPDSTAQDRMFTTFTRGLTPRFHYIWIPKRVQSLIQAALVKLARLAQRHEDIYRHVGMDATVRYGNSSTMLHVDILNQGARAVMSIPNTHEPVLEANLRALGVPEGGWFVCAHAREHGWFKELNAHNLRLPEEYRHEQEDHRNVYIADYYPEFEQIIAMGGRVIRMGDPSMKPVTMEGVIDYPFTKHWSLPMDLYLVSQ